MKARVYLRQIIPRAFDYILLKNLRTFKLQLELLQPAPVPKWYRSFHNRTGTNKPFYRFGTCIIMDVPIFLPAINNVKCVGNTTKGDGDDRTRLEARVHAGTCVPSVGKDPRLKSSGKNAGSNSYF
jgi:hypothetical protein